jgi:hypothetical protein
MLTTSKPTSDARHLEAIGVSNLLDQATG